MVVGNWAAVFVLEEEIEGGVVTFGEDNEWAEAERAAQEEAEARRNAEERRKTEQQRKERERERITSIPPTLPDIQIEQRPFSPVTIDFPAVPSSVHATPSPFSTSFSIPSPPPSPTGRACRGRTICRTRPSPPRWWARWGSRAKRSWPALPASPACHTVWSGWACMTACCS